MGFSVRYKLENRFGKNRLMMSSPLNAVRATVVVHAIRLKTGPFT